VIPLTYYLILAAALFSVGLYGALSKRNAILVLMSIELMLNAANINLVAFSGYVTPETLRGQAFAIFIMVIAASEVGLGLALVLLLYRQRGTVEVDQFNMLRG